MKLPEAFLNNIREMLGDAEFEKFLASYEQPRHFGLRVNTLKASIEDFLKKSSFSLKPIPWTRDGFYYEEGVSPGRHPYYHAGLYYIQEPSAMLPGEVMDAKPGEKILDICAAPGGKTVQIAAGMKGEGLLIANDINSDRVKVLVKNIELYGVKNAVVTNETPQRLARTFAGYFDKILIDAPCSGEGMFRKDEEAARSWEKFKCEKCAGMQWDILQWVDKMLKPGGTIVYSTCTFSPEEDEKMISRFMEACGGYEIVDVPKTGGIQGGMPQWSDGNPDLAKTARLWPHHLKGEGHFVAKLWKKTESGQVEESGKAFQKEKLEDGCLEAYRKFERENLNVQIQGNFFTRGSNLYCLPCEIPDLNGIKLAKFGWYLGGFMRDRFEPSHSLVTALKKEEIKNTLDLSSGSREVLSYLKGETLLLEGEKGLSGVCVDGFTLGWAKQAGDVVKNLYPKGWRKMS